ncbi:MAG: DUF1629 domain-containing protein [Pseudomonadota bacterium]
MPYILDIPRHLPGCMNWSDLPQTPKDSSKFTSLSGMSHDAMPPIPFVQAHYEENLELFPIPRELPDVFQGRWSRSFFVSARFKDVFRSVEPKAHYFQPVDLTMLDGTQFPRGYFALGVEGRVEAIDVANSDVKEKHFDGKFLYYAAKSGEPFIQWQSEKIAGHHLWIDRHFPSHGFISDEMYKALKRAGIKGLSVVPSAITGGVSSLSNRYLSRLARRLRRFRHHRYDALDKLHE